MKSAVIPQVLVEPEFRVELEALLRPGETLSEFVEASVRSAVEHRHMQIRLHERGQATLKHDQRTSQLSDLKGAFTRRGQPAVPIEQMNPFGIRAPAPTGHATWLDYAVEAFDTRMLATEHLFSDDPAPSRDAMRQAARDELAELRHRARQ